MEACLDWIFISYVLTQLNQLLLFNQANLFFKFLKVLSQLIINDDGPNNFIVIFIYEYAMHWRALKVVNFIRCFAYKVTKRVYAINCLYKIIKVFILLISLYLRNQVTPFSYQ